MNTDNTTEHDSITRARHEGRCDVLGKLDPRKAAELAAELGMPWDPLTTDERIAADFGAAVYPDGDPVRILTDEDAAADLAGTPRPGR